MTYKLIEKWEKANRNKKYVDEWNCILIFNYRG